MLRFVIDTQLPVYWRRYCPQRDGLLLILQNTPEGHLLNNKNIRKIEIEMISVTKTKTFVIIFAKRRSQNLLTETGKYLEQRIA